MCGDLDPAFACPLCRDGNECYCGASCAAADAKHLSQCVANQPAEEEAQQPGRTGARGGGDRGAFSNAPESKAGGGVAEAEPFDSEEDGEEDYSDYEGEEGEEGGRGGFGGLPPEILRMMMMRGGVGGKGGPPREDPNVVHARRVREGLQELCRGVSPVVEGDRVGKSTREEDMVAVLGSTEVAVDFIPAFIERLHKVHGVGGE